MAAVTLSVLIGSVAPASAQAPGQGARTDIGGVQGAGAFSVRGHFSVWAGGGLDLDVISGLTQSSLGRIRNTQMLINPASFPDVYVRTQRRRYASVGFGIFKKTELIARYQDATNPSSTVLLGVFASNDNEFAVNFDQYKDRVIEFGLRKYMATPKSVRQYFALVGGMKTVQPLSMNMRLPGGDVRARMYEQSRVPSVGLDFGFTFEFHKVGAYLETGLRYQGRLKRTDEDLALYELDSINNTGWRAFMPLTLGVMFRF